MLQLRVGKNQTSISPIPAEAQHLPIRVLKELHHRDLSPDLLEDHLLWSMAPLQRTSSAFLFLKLWN